MNLLIVDDERTAVEAVLGGISWQLLDSPRLLTAASKAEAIAIFEANEIDLVICDIEMPMGSGLELLAWINENREDVFCIFMTCHAEFTFAQKAMQLGSFDYILKPIDFPAMEAVLLRAYHKLRERRHLKRTYSYWLDSRKDVGRQFWKDFFIGDIAPTKESIAHYWRQKEMAFPLDLPYLPILLSVKRWSENIGTEDHKLFLYALRNVADELFDLPGLSREVIPFTGDLVLVMLCIQEQGNAPLMPTLKALCGRVTEVAREHLYAGVSCYIGAPKDICRIPQMLEMLQTIDRNNVLRSSSLIAMEDYEAYDGAQYKNQSLGRWFELLHHGQFDAIARETREMLEARIQDGTVDRAYLDRLFRDANYLLFAFSAKHQVFLDKLLKGEESLRLIEQANASVEDFIAWIDHIFPLLEAYERDSDASDLPVEQAKQYIARNLTEELTVDSIAAHVHLNADYLNRMFKKEMGVVISRYVIEQKMNKAKWLLENTPNTIGSIATEVGYGNYSSFTRMFTKVVGMSPYDYKKGLEE